MSGQVRMTAAEYRRDRLVEMDEAAFLNDVRQLAKKRRWLEYHTHRSERSTPGFPDLVLARRGRLIIAELKAVTGRWGEGQREWLGHFSGTTAETWSFGSEVEVAPFLLVACWTPLDFDRINEVLT